LQPHGSLSESDFVRASEVIDPSIAEDGSLPGLIIIAKEFPGWESFGALVSHIKFVKNHHAKSILLPLWLVDSTGDSVGTAP
jgi:hypothetical protein